MKTGTFFTLASVTAISFIATTIAKKAIIPIHSAARHWDDCIMYKVYPSPGKVNRTLKSFYFVCNNGNSFKLFDRNYVKTIQSTESAPSWVITGLDELSQPRYFPTHFSTQAMFAAKYVTVASNLSARTKQDLNILGMAFFEKATTFSPEQQRILRTAVISLLMSM